RRARASQRTAFECQGALPGRPGTPTAGGWAGHRGLWQSVRRARDGPGGGVMDSATDGREWPRAWAGDRMTRRQGMDRWGVAITGTGSALPGAPITNDELLARHPLPT